MQIAIVIPSNDMVHADFAFSLAKLIGHHSITRPTDLLAVVNPRSSLVQKGRTDGVNHALAFDADFILFIDSDQTFPPDALERLIDHQLPIVGAASVTRRPPIEYTTRNSKGERINIGEYEGLVQVATNGFAFCLIDAKVFREIPLHQWFVTAVMPDDHRWISEDESFCFQAAAKNVPVWVDADLSKEIGHVGQHVFTAADVKPNETIQ